MNHVLKKTIQKNKDKILNSIGQVTAIAIKENNSIGYKMAEIGDGIDISTRMDHHRGCVQRGLAQTLKTKIEVGVIDEMLRIRKLTPKECLRLQGFEDKDYQALKDYGISDSAIYRMAGDSITSSVLIGMFSQLLGLDSTEIIEDYVERVKEDKVIKCQ